MLHLSRGIVVLNVWTKFKRRKVRCKELTCLPTMGNVLIREPSCLLPPASSSHSVAWDCATASPWSFAAPWLVIGASHPGCEPAANPASQRSDIDTSWRCLSWRGNAMGCKSRCPGRVVEPTTWQLWSGARSYWPKLESSCDIGSLERRQPACWRTSCLHEPLPSS